MMTRLLSRISPKRCDILARPPDKHACALTVSIYNVVVLVHGVKESMVCIGGIGGLDLYLTRCMQGLDN